MWASFGLCLVVAVILSVPRMQFLAPGEGVTALQPLKQFSPNEGRRTGWTIGGNDRWRNANTLGYERLPDATGAPGGNLNVSRALFGKKFWDLGAMGSCQRRVFGNGPLRAQLSIQNLPSWQTPRLVKSDYDTTAIYGATNAIVPVLWESRPPAMTSSRRRVDSEFTVRSPCASTDWL